MSHAMNNVFAQACNDFFQNEFTELGQLETDSMPVQSLSAKEVEKLAKKIIALPQEDMHLLFFRYCFHFSPKNTDCMLETENSVGKLRYVRGMLSCFMELTRAQIADDSMECACAMALSEYTGQDCLNMVMHPKYSSKFRRKLKEIKAAQTNIIAIVAKQVAAAAIICIVCFSTALAASASLRELFLNWVVETFPQYSIFVPKGMDDTSRINLPNWSDFEIGYVPDGFVLKEKKELRSMISYQYSNQEGADISITISIPTNFYFDTKDATIYEIPFKGLTACHWTRNEMLFFIWQQDNIACHIIAKINLEEAMKIAENVERKILTK